MLEMYVGGRFTVDPTDPRNQFHERALREARLVHEYRECMALLAEPQPIREPEPQPGFMARLRLAVAGGTVTAARQACDCLGSAS